MVMKNTLRATCRLQIVRTKLHYCDLYDAKRELEFVKVLMAMAQTSMIFKVLHDLHYTYTYIYARYISSFDLNHNNIFFPFVDLLRAVKN
ncbi:hypothetical protein ACSBR1_042911 [Camellia fascicularis]